jgi:predicted DsbA family dithiol-disulfide isomerase
MLVAGTDVLRVWTDFLCPFARIGAFWLRNVEATGRLGFEIEWRTFSLEQINLPEDGDVEALWATADERRGLLPAAAAKWAEAQGLDVFESVQRAFFDARHVDRKKIGQPEVTAEVLSSVGLDGDAVLAELREGKWLAAARADHEEGAELGVFGVPTLVFPDAMPFFVRLMEIPDGDRAVEVFGKVRAMAEDPAIHEIKGPSLSR